MKWRLWTLSGSQDRFPVRKAEQMDETVSTEIKSHLLSSAYFL